MPSRLPRRRPGSFDPIWVTLPLVVLLLVLGVFLLVGVIDELPTGAAPSIESVEPAAG